MIDRRPWLRRTLVVGLSFIACASRAEAHLVTTGLGPFYDGITHFSTSVDDLLPALALALYAGLRGPLPGRRALFALPLAWLAGGLLGALPLHSLQIPAPMGAGILAGTFLALGLLVAADLRLPPTAVIAIALAVGLIHGFINGLALAEDGTTHLAAILQLLGVTTALFVLVALAAALVVALRPAWARIVVRVAGSWIAAMGLLWLGWSLTGRG